MSRLLSKTSVPNTWVAARASALVAMPPSRADERTRAVTAMPRGGMCECGLPKAPSDEGCERCTSYDSGKGAAGVLLRALADMEPRTVYEIASEASRTWRSILRSIKPLVESGRVRTWLEPREPTDGVTDGPAAFRGRRGNHPVRMYQRAW